jgi:hypothetical protein
MSDWLDDELAEIAQEKQEENSNAERLTLLQKQTDVLWEHLKTELARSVDRMNEPDSQFRKMTGGVNISPIKDANKIKVRKPHTMPKIEVEVSREPVAVSWHYTVSRDAKDLEGRPTGQATLHGGVDKKGLPVFKQGTTELTIADAARQILRPILRPELLDQ